MKNAESYSASGQERKLFYLLIPVTRSYVGSIGVQMKNSVCDSSDMKKRISEISILGFRFHPMTKEDVIGCIRNCVRSRSRLVMGNLNLHGMALMYKSKGMRDLLSGPNALVMVDGMPIIWIAQLLGFSLTRSQRMTSLDYFDDMFKIGVAEGWRFDYVGSTPDVLKKGLVELKRRIPNLDIEGRDGYFDMDVEGVGTTHRDILDWLRSRNSDVLIVGMGMPRQEEWLELIRNEIPTRILIPVGAYLEYQVGSLALPPRWLGQLGLEWLYRLFTAPRRLAYRYLIEPFVLFFYLIFRSHPQRAYWEEKKVNETSS